MIAGEASAVVRASPAEVLDFFCDLERYKEADTKIRAVLGVEPTGGDTVVRIRSRIRGLPTPPVRQLVKRTGDERVDVADITAVLSRLVSFRAWVTCAPQATGTLVTHREELEVRGPLKPLAERWLGAWWAQDIYDEVGRLARILGPVEAVAP